MFYLIEPSSERIKSSSKSITDAVTNGFKVVKVPDEVPIDSDVSPFTETQLQSQKYSGLLAKYLDFSFVQYDILDDATGWNTAATGFRGAVGNNVAWVAPNDGVADGRLETITIDISSDGSFKDFLVYWDLYSVPVETTGLLTRTKYVEEVPESVNVSISNDGGSTFTSVLHTQPIELAGAGNQLVLRFDNADTDRYYIGSYAILY